MNNRGEFKYSHKAYPIVDIFCGIGGLTHGFVLEGFQSVAGYDTDVACKYSFEVNNRSEFIEADVELLTGAEVNARFPEDLPRILVGCAPCQPFSSYTNKQKSKDQKKWSLLSSYGRIIDEIEPEVISMENVPSLSGKQIFRDFLVLLKKNGYDIWWENVFCPDYGVPQRRNRLVLLGSRLGDISLIDPTHSTDQYKTVRDTIDHLPRLQAGEVDSEDPLHRASNMSSLNLKRIRNSVPGGTWRDWDENLLATCHKRESGSSYYNVYARMEWDELSPTITTQFIGFGNGRFGHPEQDRALSLREGALLQTFPVDYQFVDPVSQIYITRLAKHIGNAVPVKLARVIAQSIREHLNKHIDVING